MKLACHCEADATGLPQPINAQQAALLAHALSAQGIDASSVSDAAMASSVAAVTAPGKMAPRCSSDEVVRDSEADLLSFGFCAMNGQGSMFWQTPVLSMCQASTFWRTKQSSRARKERELLLPPEPPSLLRRRRQVPGQAAAKVWWEVWQALAGRSVIMVLHLEAGATRMLCKRCMPYKRCTCKE